LKKNCSILPNAIVKTPVQPDNPKKLCVSVCLYVLACICTYRRESERERECVCVCVRERASESVWVRVKKRVFMLILLPNPIHFHSFEILYWNIFFNYFINSRAEEIKLDSKSNTLWIASISTGTTEDRNPCFMYLFVWYLLEVKTRVLTLTLVQTYKRKKGVNESNNFSHFITLSSMVYFFLPQLCRQRGW